MNTRMGKPAALDLWVLCFLAGLCLSPAGNAGMKQDESVREEIEKVLDQVESKEPKLDMDGDGKIDAWRRFDDEGLVAAIDYDTDADGKADEFTEYLDGRTVTLRGPSKEKALERETRKLNEDGDVVSVLLEKRDGKAWKTVAEQTMLFEEKKIKVRKIADDGKEEVSYEPLVR